MESENLLPFLHDSAASSCPELFTVVTPHLFTAKLRISDFKVKF
jgi:hypothetical protein